MGELVCLYIIPVEVSAQVRAHLLDPKSGGYQVYVLPVSLGTSVRMVLEKKPIAVVIWIAGDPVPIVRRFSADCLGTPLVVMTDKTPTEKELLSIREAGAAEAFYSAGEARENLVRFLSQLRKV